MSDTILRPERNAKGTYQIANIRRMKNANIQDRVKRKLMESAEALKEELPSYKPAGFIVGYAFFNELAGYQTTVFTSLSDTPEEIAIEIAKHIKLQMMRAYGHEQRNVGEKEIADQGDPSIGGVMGSVEGVKE
jgi:hypothetical protein